MNETRDMHQLQTQAAALYYIDGLSQVEIAQRLYVSRSTISRLIKSARESGLVSVSINFATGRNAYYEQKLKDKFQIEAIVIQPSSTSEIEIRESLCNAFAEWIGSHISEYNIIGLTRGTMIYRTGCLLQPQQLRQDISFVQLMGTESAASTQIIAQDVVRKYADCYHGKAYFIDAPLVFFNDAAREALLKVPSIKRTMDMAQKTDLILTTLPIIHKGMNNHIWNGFVDESVYDEIVNLGGVGCIFGRAFDIDGQFLDVPLNRSIICVEPRFLRSKHVAAICYGAEFAPAALGALRGSFIRTLVTDSECAEHLLKLAGKF